jgi:hypothetical protein
MLNSFLTTITVTLSWIFGERDIIKNKLNKIYLCIFIGWHVICILGTCYLFYKEGARCWLEGWGEWRGGRLMGWNCGRLMGNGGWIFG